MNLSRIRQLRTYLGQRQSHHMLTIDNGQAAELDAALAAAEALARLRELLGSVDHVCISECDVGDKRGVSVEWRDGGVLGKGAWGPTLLAALTQALDEAEAKP